MQPSKAENHELVAGFFGHHPESTEGYKLFQSGTVESENPIQFVWVESLTYLNQILERGQTSKLRRLMQSLDVVIIGCDENTQMINEILTRFKLALPAFPVLVCGPKPGPRELISILSAGAEGYMLSTASHRSHAKAIRDFGKNRDVVLDQKLINILVDGLQASRSPALPTKKLSKVQQEICRLLVQGKRYDDIANDLGVNVDNVRYHIKQIYQKYGVNKGTQLINLLSITPV